MAHTDIHTHIFVIVASIERFSLAAERSRELVPQTRHVFVVLMQMSVNLAWRGGVVR